MLLEASWRPGREVLARAANYSLSCCFSGRLEHVIEVEFAQKAALFHALGAELAAAISPDMSGPLAAEVLPEMLARGASG